MMRAWRRYGASLLASVTVEPRAASCSLQVTEAQKQGRET